jgi:hypothetical protein
MDKLRDFHLLYSQMRIQIKTCKISDGQNGKILGDFEDTTTHPYPVIFEDSSLLAAVIYQVVPSCRTGNVAVRRFPTLRSVAVLGHRNSGWIGGFQ